MTEEKCERYFDPTGWNCSFKTEDGDDMNDNDSFDPWITGRLPACQFVSTYNYRYYYDDDYRGGYIKG